MLWAHCPAGVANASAFPGLHRLAEGAHNPTNRSIQTRLRKLATPGHALTAQSPLGMVAPPSSLVHGFTSSPAGRMVTRSVTVERIRGSEDRPAVSTRRAQESGTMSTIVINIGRQSDG